MINLYDIAYAAGVGLAAPVWLLRAKTRKKVLKAFAERMGQALPPRDTTKPAVMIHAVSLGEMNATRGLVSRLRELRPDVQVIISATTETGYARALELYANPEHAGHVAVIHYPLDFTRGINRVLDRLRPGLVALMELEVWPNFILQCTRRSIPIVVVNGRMTELSFGKYRKIRPVMARTLRRIAHICTQDEANASRFRTLGVEGGRISVTGTMKFDTATVADRIPGDEDLARAVGLEPGKHPVLVCGSTGPGEEQIICRVLRQALPKYPDLRTIIVPRHPDRFGEVAELLRNEGFAVLRRSTGKVEPANGEATVPPIILGDTMGELRKFYSLATVVIVGRTFVDLGPRQHGSDMIEPAALAKPVIVGPWTTNFSEPMARFREADAIVEADSPDSIQQALDRFLSDPAHGTAVGGRARAVVVQNKGATERHVQVILAHLR